MRSPKYWTRFLRDVKLMEKRGRDMEKLWSVTDDLIYKRPLSPLRRDHALTGEWAGFRDCHLEGDWILIYRLDRDREPEGAMENVTFARTGTHSDIF